MPVLQEEKTAYLYHYIKNFEAQPEDIDFKNGYEHHRPGRYGGGSMTYFTDNPFEKIMTQKTGSGRKEKLPYKTICLCIC
ncbi:MAG: hypothetical protein K2K87_10210 [Lachnospiraceae bacterium]|nr:hypothetical protein [Lachnospiraceae bacterium]